MIGVVSLLAVVTMRQDFAGSGADAASLTVTANALVDVRNWTFLFGPGLMPVLNAVLLRHPALPLAAGAPHHPDRRPDRRAPAVRRLRREPVRRHRAGLGDLLLPDPADRGLGAHASASG